MQLGIYAVSQKTTLKDETPLGDQSFKPLEQQYGVVDKSEV